MLRSTGHLPAPPRAYTSQTQCTAASRTARWSHHWHHTDGSALTARELANRTAAHGAGPATTRRLRCQAAAPTGRLLTPSSDRYLSPYSWSPRFWHPAAPSILNPLLQFRVRTLRGAGSIAAILQYHFVNRVVTRAVRDDPESRTVLARDWHARRPQRATAPRRTRRFAGRSVRQSTQWSPFGRGKG